MCFRARALCPPSSSFLPSSLPPPFLPSSPSSPCPPGIRRTAREQPADDTASTVSEESPPQSPRDVWAGRTELGSKRADAAGAPLASPAIRTASSGIIGPEGQVMMRAPVKGGGGGSSGRGGAVSSGEARGVGAARVPHMPLFKSRGEGKRAVLVDRQQEGTLELAI